MPDDSTRVPRARLGLAGTWSPSIQPRTAAATRIRAVLGRRRVARPAAEPAHRYATAGQDPRGRSGNAARRQQPRDQGVLSGILGRLRAPSPPDIGHRRVRAGVGAQPALFHGLHLPRAPRRGALPVQGAALAKAGDGMLPSDFFRRNVDRRRQHHVGLGLSAQRVDVSPIGEDPGPGSVAGRPMRSVHFVRTVFHGLRRFFSFGPHRP
jgi:hypothetical protein